MASLQELRKRLKSIRSTQQLAGAMRTAATAKYAKLGKVRGEFAPYAGACRDMLGLLGSAGIPHTADTVNKRDCYLILSGNRGLCGGFHAELFRFFEEELEGKDDPLILCCGSKASAYLQERGLSFEEYAVSDVPAYGEIRPVAERLRTAYENGEAARIFVIRQRFRNMLIQTPAAEQLLPEENGSNEEASDTLLYLPDKETIRLQLAKSCFDARIYDMALENAVGAQAATVMAMRSACDNAESAAAELEIRINRRRQAEVTSGVIETASGNYQTGD